MINKLLNIFSKNKKSIFFILFFVFAFFAFSDISFAWDAWTANWNLLDDKTKENVAKFIQWAWSIIVVFLSILTYLWVMFLSPEWINGSLFGLNEYFKDIWILVSNVVYFIFAFILIWIAFMNIIWKWQDKYQLKQALPKFLIWILIVPLSWFIVNFILSISAILTVAAINLPFDTFQWFNSEISEVKIPNNCEIDLTKESWKSDADGETPNKKYFHCVWWEVIKLWDLMDSNNSSVKIFWVLWTYAYGVLWLDNLDHLTDFDINTIKTIWDLIVKLVFDVLFIVVYAVLMIALALVLMTRWIYIWIYLMISPVFGLMYFFDKSSWGWEFFDKFNLKQFVSLAMVPVYTMLALTFWLLFIFVVWQWMVSGNTSNSFSWLKSVKIDSNDETNTSTLTIWSSEKEDEKFKLTIKWAAANEDNITKIWERVKTEWNWWLWVIWTLIMKIFGIVILWWAVMAALRSNDVTKAVVEPLHAFGTQVWQLAAKSPQYMPVFWGQSMKSLEQVGQKFQWYANTSTTNRSSDLWKKFWLENDYTSNMQRNIDSARSVWSWTEIANVLDKSFQDMWRNEVRLQSTEFKRLLDAIASNTSTAVSPEFKTFMSSLAWKESLNNSEIIEALQKLESNWQIDISVNWDAINWAWLNIPDLVAYVKSWGSNNSLGWWGNWNSIVQQEINLKIDDNTTTNLDLTGSRLWLTRSEIDIMNNLDNVSSMTKEGFVNELKRKWISDSRSNSIVEAIILNNSWIFKSSDPTN